MDRRDKGDKIRNDYINNRVNNVNDTDTEAQNAVPSSVGNSWIPQALINISLNYFDMT